MINVTANARRACAYTDDVITSGSIGIPVSFSLSADFDGLSNIAVFRGSGATVDVILTDNSCVVPPETIATAGGDLWVGVYGRNTDGTIAIPTVWAGALNIALGAVPSGVDPSEPTPDWTAQVQAAATEALQVANAVAAQAAAGDFDGDPGPEGAPGFSPVATVEQTPTGATITVTDAEGTTTASITNGQDGADGVSPTITITDITGGHLVTITDADGTHSMDVMDGTDGEDGVGVPAGGTTGQVLSKASGTDYDTEWTTPDPGGVQDVQVAGTSVLSDGVANIPYPSGSNPGVVRVISDRGITLLWGEVLDLVPAGSGNIKAGTGNKFPVCPPLQHESTFYGLAKAAGDTTQSASSNAVGTYTESAKSAISTMLSGSVSVSGTAPTITALPGIRYVCGEVTTIDITTPASGIVDVVFTSGSTPAVLTVTPPSGTTMKWANGFDPTSLEANTVYKIEIMDGIYATATAWN